MNKEQLERPDINGWGVDADPKNDPTYPMKKRTAPEQRGRTWKRPAQQESGVEVYHSNERPEVSAVFGTCVPPAGLSGAIRRHAFNFSETSYRHWIPLLIADRINMIEGVVDDFSRGHVPNLFEEMGLIADWKHDRPNFLAKCVAGVAIAAAVYCCVNNKKRTVPNHRVSRRRLDR